MYLLLYSAFSWTFFSLYFFCLLLLYFLFSSVLFCQCFLSVPSGHPICSQTLSHTNIEIKRCQVCMPTSHIYILEFDYPNPKSISLLGSKICLISYLPYVLWGNRNMDIYWILKVILVMMKVIYCKRVMQFIIGRLKYVFWFNECPHLFMVRALKESCLEHPC